MKKLIFLLVFLSLPYGVKGQCIFLTKTDTVWIQVHNRTVNIPKQYEGWWINDPLNLADTFGYTPKTSRTKRVKTKSCDSTWTWMERYPNWQDSIKQCKKEIKIYEEYINELEQAKITLIKDMSRLGKMGKYEWENVETYAQQIGIAKTELRFIFLQLQIFQLQEKLQNKRGE